MTLSELRTDDETKTCHKHLRLEPRKKKAPNNTINDGSSFYF